MCILEDLMLPSKIIRAVFHCKKNGPLISRMPIIMFN